MSSKFELLTEGATALKGVLEDSVSVAEKLLVSTDRSSPAAQKLAHMDLGLPPIQTDRLLLRKPGEGDLRVYERTLGDETVMKYMTGPLPSSDLEEALRNNSASWDRHGDRKGIVVERGSLRDIGIARVATSRIPFQDGTEIGWALRPEFQGRGYATELTKGLLSHAFDNLKAERVVAATSPDNAGANRIFSKMNFQFVAQRPVLYWGPQNIWALSSDAWRVSK